MIHAQAQTPEQEERRVKIIQFCETLDPAVKLVAIGSELTTHELVGALGFLLFTFATELERDTGVEHLQPVLDSIEETRKHAIMASSKATH